MADITLFHTAQVHVARFEAIRDTIAPGQNLIHIVNEGWLVRAQNGIDDSLATEIKTAIQSASGVTLCTCTSLGAVAETIGAIRIDRPMMIQAAKIGGDICLAICVKSTAAGSLALMQECIETAGNIHATVRLLFIDGAWDSFLAGDNAAYATAIEHAVRTDIAAHSTSVVLLAQASMDCAAAGLADLGIPVLTPAASALQQALKNADQQ